MWLLSFPRKQQLSSYKFNVSSVAKRAAEHELGPGVKEESANDSRNSR